MKTDNSNAKTGNEQDPVPIEDVNEAISEKEILDNIVDGTLEQKDRDYLAVQYRRTTGVMGKAKSIKFFMVSSKWMKGFSIANSALGLTILVLMLTKGLFFSAGFYAAMIVGLMVGLFFEAISTNFEKYFVKSYTDDEEEGRVYKKILVVIKIYAVAMVTISGWNLPEYTISSSAKVDNSYITSREGQIERLKQDKLTASTTNVSFATDTYGDVIRALRADKRSIEAEKTPILIQNSTSTQIRKRNDALKLLKRINDRIALKDRDIKDAQASLVNTVAPKSKKDLIEENIQRKENEIAIEREKLRNTTVDTDSIDDLLLLKIMFVFLFVFIELGGTLTSIFSRRELLKALTPEQVYADEITEQLMSKAVARNNREVRLNATKMVAELATNKATLATIEAEVKVANQNHVIKENSRISAIRRENAKMLTDQRLSDLETGMMLNIAGNVSNKVKTGKELDSELEKLMT